MKNPTMNIASRIQDLEKLFASDIDLSSIDTAEMNIEQINSVPLDVLKIYTHALHLNANISEIFLGFQAIELKDVVSGLYPGGGFRPNVDSSSTSEMPEIYLVESVNVGFDESLKIRDVENLFPIFVFDDDYMYLYKSSSPELSGVLTVIDGMGTFLAPSLSMHLEDLMFGIRSGIYIVRDGELIFPSSWRNRTKLRSGEISMDNYGNVIEE